LARDLGNPGFIEVNLRLAPISDEAPTLDVPGMREWPQGLCDALPILLVLVS
jgi:hypothetical protein